MPLKNQTPLFCLCLWKLSVFELHLFAIFIAFYPEANLQLVLLSKINVSTWQISFWRGCACTFPTLLFIRHGTPRFYNKRNQIRGHQKIFTKMKSNPRLQEIFYKNETKSEAARKILQQRNQIRGCKKGGLAAGIWNQIWSWSWRALWLVWVYKPKILQNIKSGQQLHNSIGLFHYSLNELLDDSSQS